MQTFLPYPDFVKSAKAIDYRRCGKQRLEAMQLVNSTLKLLENPDARVGWMNHPARAMWDGYLPALKHYHNIFVQEWVSRGYKNTMKLYDDIPDTVVLPPWVGDERVHSSHRSNLLRKDPTHYAQFGWSEPDNMEYYWPVL